MSCLYTFITGCKINPLSRSNSDFSGAFQGLLDSTWGIVLLVAVSSFAFIIVIT